MFVQPFLPCKSSYYYIFSVCICSLRYRACKAHAILYCQLWPLRDSQHFSTSSHKRHDFRKITLLNIKYVLWYSHLSEIFLISRRIGWDIIINVHKSLCRVPLFLSDFNETWIFLTDLLKLLVKCHQNQSSGSRVVSCRRTYRRTDRHDGANSRFSQFCERS